MCSLAGIPPQGVKESAPCKSTLPGYLSKPQLWRPQFQRGCELTKAIGYEATPNSGQAACSYANIVYPEDGRSPFPIALPGSFNKDTKTVNVSVTTTTRFANSSRTFSASTKTTAGFVDGLYVSNIFNLTDSTPARITASFSNMQVKQYAANLENKDTYPSLTSVMDTVPSTGVVSVIGTPTGTTSTGGVRKLVAQAWGMWVAAMAFGVMAV